MSQVLKGSVCFRLERFADYNIHLSYATSRKDANALLFCESFITVSRLEIYISVHPFDKVNYVTQHNHGVSKDKSV